MLRTAIRVQGPKPSRPQAVAGKVREKATTPRAAWTVPKDAPPPGCALAAPTAIRGDAVALLCALMQERSSVADLVTVLRRELECYSPGGKLPSSRALVDRFRVSPVTVSRALAQLAAEGLVVTRPGAGAFRARPRPSAVPAGDTSWQEVALSADGAADVVP
ncbi:winged helix-turn-helix domain-containing protein, partial [Streptomyces tendae]|uniref:winged helix-turn-helix domain-containing protein n=1 Tax=Streptomyces tendae TaxID=1932 RepID=UPI0033EFFBDA